MTDLRDQLLKAGLIDQQTKQQVDTAERRDKKKKKRKKKKKKQRAKEQGSDEQRLQAWQDRVAAQAAENRARAAAEHAERESHERRNRLANLVDAWALRITKPGNQRFCFVTREQRIRWLWVTAELAFELERGALAIVDNPGDTDLPHALVPRQAAERIRKLDPEAIRFWNPEGPPSSSDGSPGSPEGPPSSSDGSPGSPEGPLSRADEPPPSTG